MWRFLTGVSVATAALIVGGSLWGSAGATIAEPSASAATERQDQVPLRRCVRGGVTVSYVACFEPPSPEIVVGKQGTIVVG